MRELAEAEAAGLTQAPVDADAESVAGAAPVLREGDGTVTSWFVPNGILNGTQLLYFNSDHIIDR
jgi:hypothetical protein